MIITTLEELWEKALLLETDDILERYYSDQFKKLAIEYWKKLPGKTFNTKNGVLVFTDETTSMYVIPKFDGLTKLLRSNGFRQNYLMPVPFADNFYPKIHRSYWEHLKAEFRQQYA